MLDEIGCFPCIKRLMLFSQVMVIPIAVSMIEAIINNEHWNAIVRGEREFPKIVQKNDTFFNEKLFKPDGGSPALKKVWSKLARSTDLELTSFGILMAFLAISFAHFIGFCSCRDMCFARKSLRIITYSIYTAGAFVFLGTAWLTYYATFGVHWSDYKQIWHRDHNMRIPDDDFIYIGKSNIQDPLKWTKLMKSDLQKITSVCYDAIPDYVKTVSEFHHVFPTDPLLPADIQGVFYHPHELIILEFCNRFDLAIDIIVLGSLGAIFCILVPLIGSWQLTDETIEKLKHIKMSAIDDEHDHEASVTNTWLVTPVDHTRKLLMPSTPF